MYKDDSITLRPSGVESYDYNDTFDVEIHLQFGPLRARFAYIWRQNEVA